MQPAGLYDRFTGLRWAIVSELIEHFEKLVARLSTPSGNCMISKPTPARSMNG
jgi:hypothetical protein